MLSADISKKLVAVRLVYVMIGMNQCLEQRFYGFAKQIVLSLIRVSLVEADCALRDAGPPGHAVYLAVEEVERAFRSFELLCFDLIGKSGNPKIKGVLI